MDGTGSGLALNNDIVEVDGRAAGEPTELALYQAAHAAGYDKQRLEREQPRLAVIAFDSERKLMTTLHRAGAGVVAYVKGAPETVLAQCVDVRQETGTQPLDADAMLAVAAQLAAEGYRVLALARRELTDAAAAASRIDRAATDPARSGRADRSATAGSGAGRGGWSDGGHHTR